MPPKQFLCMTQKQLGSGWGKGANSHGNLSEGSDLYRLCLQLVPLFGQQLRRGIAILIRGGEVRICTFKRFLRTSTRDEKETMLD